jgi:phosphotransferase system enzyme I (PtsI)
LSGGRERRGVAASPGIAIGVAFVLRRERLVIPEYRIEPEQVEAEVARLELAFDETRTQLDLIREGMKGVGLIVELFDAQFLFLKDPVLFENAIANVRTSRLNAEWALQRELRRLETLFERMPDTYLRERSSDVSFVVRRVLQALMGREPEGLRNVPPGVIVVAEDLSTAELAHIEPGQIHGIVTEGGSRTSHVTIVARSLEIPAVVGVGEGFVSGVADGSELIVDGHAGVVISDADASTVAEFEKRRHYLEALERRLLRYANLPAETQDGIRIRTLANIDQLAEVHDAMLYGAEGIGLYRTEFMFMNRIELPGEEEQFEHYRDILEAVAPHSAVIRTLDLGGEKVPGEFGLGDEPNPALGLRGVRMSAGRPEVFRVQLRALLRASAYGQLKILIPMVSSLTEVQFARHELGAAREQLRAEGHRVADHVQIGVMIETPAAALTADVIAPRVDFLSIGTNDLLQYTLAVDRTNEHVAYLYEPLHPAHLRLIQRICQAARRAGIAAGMCGEMAGDPLNCWLLVALGVGELSMAPFSIPLLKKILRESSGAEARELLAQALRLSSAAEIRRAVESCMSNRFRDEFVGILPTR